MERQHKAETVPMGTGRLSFRRRLTKGAYTDLKHTFGVVLLQNLHGGSII